MSGGLYTGQKQQPWAASPAPNPRNQLRGAQNRAQGEVFEKMITAACEEYARRGTAFIEKTPEPMRVIRNLGAGLFEARFTAAAQPDYKGTMAGGRAVCFEAKTAAGGRIKRERVTPAQMRALQLHEDHGGEVFILVCLDFRTFHRVPFPVWREMKERFGHLHMTEEDLKPYRVSLAGGFIDFLGVKDTPERASFWV